MNEQYLPDICLPTLFIPTEYQKDRSIVWELREYHCCLLWFRVQFQFKSKSPNIFFLGKKSHSTYLPLICSPFFFIMSLILLWGNNLTSIHHYLKISITFFTVMSNKWWCFVITHNSTHKSYITHGVLLEKNGPAIMNLKMAVTWLFKYT